MFVGESVSSENKRHGKTEEGREEREGDLATPATERDEEEQEEQAHQGDGLSWEGLAVAAARGQDVAVNHAGVAAAPAAFVGLGAVTAVFWGFVCCATVTLLGFVLTLVHFRFLVADPFEAGLSLVAGD